MGGRTILTIPLEQLVEVVVSSRFDSFQIVKWNCVKIRSCEKLLFCSPWGGKGSSPEALAKGVIDLPPRDNI